MKLYFYTSPDFELPAGSILCGAQKLPPKPPALVAEVVISVKAAEPFRAVPMELPRGEWFVFPPGILAKKARSIRAV